MLSSSMRERAFRLTSSVWLIALVALLLRVAYFCTMAHLIPAAVLAAVPFQNEVGNVSSALAQGQGFCCLFRQSTGPTAWLAPVYPLLVASIFKLFGIFTLRSFYAAVSLNCLFSSLATMPLFYAGKRIGGLTIAAVAGWIWAIFPSGVILPFEWIWDTSALGAPCGRLVVEYARAKRILAPARFRALWTPVGCLSAHESCLRGAPPFSDWVGSLPT